MIYEVEQYQLYAQKYRVEADSEAKAISQLFDVDGEQVGDPQYLMVAEEFGMPADEYPDIIDDLYMLDATGGLNYDVIPSIRSIKVVQ